MMANSWLEFTPAPITTANDKQPTPPASPPAPETYSAGQYVVVAVPVEDGSHRLFRAMISRVFDGEAQVTVQFMKNVKDNIWRWPYLDDLSIINYSDIVRKCQCPDMVARGRYKFND